MLKMLLFTLIVLSKHYLILLLEYALEAQSAVREPSDWARARRDWVVGGRICRPRCLVTRISVAYRSGDFLTGVIFSYPYENLSLMQTLRWHIDTHESACKIPLWEWWKCNTENVWEVYVFYGLFGCYATLRFLITAFTNLQINKKNQLLLEEKF